MSLPTSEPIPDDEEVVPSPPARRRRGRQQYIPSGNSQRTVFLESLAHRATPNLGYFPACLLAGLVFGIGIMLNSPPILLLAALIAPFMGPAVGLSLATTVGSGRFFLMELGATLIGTGLVFVGGFCSGWVAQNLGANPAEAAAQAIRFSWAHVLLLTIGALLTALSMVRSPQKPLLASVAIVYPLYIPVAASGIAAALPQLQDIFLNGLLVFAIFLTWSILIGTVSLVFQGVRPVNLFGYTLGVAITLTCLTILLGLSGLGAAVYGQIDLPPLIGLTGPTQTASPTISATTQLATETSSPTATLTEPTRTPTPTTTPSPTATPTPVWASVNAPASDGVYLRADPDSNGTILTSLLNGTRVQVLYDTAQEGNTAWSHVKTEDGLEGWIVQSLLVIATPAPEW